MATVKKQTAVNVVNSKALASAANPLFSKDNYRWMLAGIAVMALGFFLMAGGKSTDPAKFNDNEIYSTTRISIAPMLIMAGFIIEIFAIMKKPKENK